MKRRELRAGWLLRKMAVVGLLGFAVLTSSASLGIIFEADDSCEWSQDNVCDEPLICGPGSDCSDCGGCGGPIFGGGLPGAPPSGPESNPYFFSCTDSANNLCGNYYPANEQRYNELSGACYAGASSSPCSIGGSVCTHRNTSGDCIEVYQNPPASNFNSACTEPSSDGTQSSLGANCN